VWLISEVDQCKWLIPSPQTRLPMLHPYLMGKTLTLQKSISRGKTIIYMFTGFDRTPFSCFISIEILTLFSLGIVIVFPLLISTYILDKPDFLVHITD
jgi:hypothetical protein